MSRFLIIAHRTALTRELQSKVRALAAGDPEAEFAILVPEDPDQNYTWEGETVDIAQRRAEAARELLVQTTGARIVRAAVGVEDPLKAIADEIGAHAGYDALVICTLPLGISRWLGQDLVHQAARKFGLPVAHVVADPNRHERERAEPDHRAEELWRGRTGR